MGKFEEYKSDEDFLGMDMARKYIQMGLYVTLQVGLKVVLEHADTQTTFREESTKMANRQRGRR
jgi:hypothetical protein